MSNIPIALALVGTSIGVVSTGYAVLWYCNELPRHHYREFLSELTKQGSYSSGSAPD
jgi:hypothetical protein